MDSDTDVMDGGAEEAVPETRPSLETVVGSITRNITVIGGLVAAVVTFNTGLTSCSQDNIARYDAFHTAVDTEQTYWKGLYDDYLSSFDPAQTSPEQRDAKLLALNALANRPPSTFQEYDLGYFWNRDKVAQQQANQYLTSLRSGLVNALSNPEASGDAVADSAQAAIFAQGEASIAPSADAVPEQIVPVAAIVDQSAISYQNQVVATGDPAGWDIDIFWCAGANENAYYATASKAAGALASKATLNALAKLGRIRVRPLPAARQVAGSGYPATGREVRAETSETAQGNALASFLSSNAGGTAYTLRKSSTKTSNYLSVFICS